MKNKGKIVIISGPSGVGKDAVGKEVLEKIDVLEKVVTCTARKIRPGEKNGEDYATAIDSMVKLVQEVSGDFEFVAGGESRDWDFSNPVAVALAKPHAKIYKTGKVIGAEMNGKKGIHVADLNNQGSSPRDLWVPAINSEGGEIDHIFFYVDRMEDGVQVMDDLGLQSHAVVPLDSHAWDYLKHLGVIGKEVYTSLQERMEDKDSWAENMLKSDAGLDKLADMLNNRSTLLNAEKILRKGYPHLKEELMGMMAEKGLLR